MGPHAGRWHAAIRDPGGDSEDRTPCACEEVVRWNEERALPEDSHGLPLGQVKHKWAVKNLSLFCCALDIVNDRHDIKVQKGETYWIVAETDATNRDTGDQWEYTWNHTVSNEIATRAHPFMWVRYHHWSPRG